jgi:Lon protease-like protein
VQACAQCGGDVEERFRFCPWCAAPLRRKLVEFFPAHPRDAGKALRVSRYLDEQPHVRFSVWDESGTVEGAVSVDEAQAERLAQFLGPPRTRSNASLSATLKSYAAEIVARRSSTGSRKTTSS